MRYTRLAKTSWIEIKTNIFHSDRIKLIEALPQGDTILVIWFKLLVYAKKTNDDNLALSEEDMSLIFERPLSVIKLSLEVFQRYGLITLHDGVIRIIDDL